MRTGADGAAAAAAPARHLLAATALLALLIVPVALAGSSSEEPRATASASVAKKVKKLKRQMAQLRRQVNELSLKTGPAGPTGATGATGATGPPGPSTGPAGGDLTGSYPSPQIAPNAVGTAEVAGGSLTGSDIADASLGLRETTVSAFPLDRNPGVILSGTCAGQVSVGPVVDEGDLVTIVPSDELPDGFVAYGEAVDTEDQAEFRICNFSGANADPPNIGLFLLLHRF